MLLEGTPFVVLLRRAPEAAAFLLRLKSGTHARTRLTDHL